MTAKFDVRLDGILEFAGTSERRGERFDEVVAALEAARVGRESFGKMPSSGEIYSTYEERVNSTLADLKECAEAMRDIAESVRDTSQEYRNLDTGLGEVMDRISQAMSGIQAPKVGG
ncbi:hypothetical protein [Saccharothrix syringae]|uniref:ESX-1 secretion-associated protein n=1 Tax=Saccharothrix syringae TaxID=103733 RepID=A0A5Q0GUJ0_SACSY|nr:hypothetical protein [Saccharothrix syringae]QFZ17619.1 hypothetical protein EKG83_09115 [Saccharothrix syringae]